MGRRESERAREGREGKGSGWGEEREGKRGSIQYQWLADC